MEALKPVPQICSIDLTVTDGTQLRDFYVQALWFEPISDFTEVVDGKAIRWITLQLGEEQIRLVDHLEEKGRSIPSDSHSNDLWFQHIAIVVSNIERAYTHLQSFPITPISKAPQTLPPDNIEASGIRAFKFRDPDGHPLEIIWYPPDKGLKKWHRSDKTLFLGIDHSAIAISNTQKSLQFYQDLGLQVTGGSFNQGQTQAALDGLPIAEVQITALRPVVGGIGVELLDYLVQGRSIPLDRKSSDIVYAQIELSVENFDHIIEKLSSDDLQELRDEHPRACRIRDPDGHFILLIESQGRKDNDSNSGNI